jgi:hypothetical protein
VKENEEESHYEGPPIIEPAIPY